MKRKFTFLIAAAVMLLTMVATTGTMWGQTRDEVIVYTLDGTITGGSSGYATESEITQNEITWMVTGNTTMNPWRIGGKNLTNEDRPMYTTSTLSNDDITKVVVTNGTATATVNSMTLIVSANADFSNPTSTVSGSWAASSTTTFERPGGADWSDKYFKLVYNITAGSSNQYAQFIKAEFYKETGGSLQDSDLAITGDPVELEFDLYDNSTAQVVNYTTSSTGAITITPASPTSYFSYVHDAENKTITVTPLAVTPSTQTVTIAQAADATYADGSKTFTIEITDSTPFAGGDVTFDATTDIGTSPLVKNGVTFECSNGVLNNGSEYRLYKNSTTTFSLSSDLISNGYKISQIEFTGVPGNPASGFANQDGWTTNGNNGTWEGEATSVSFTASGAQVRATQIVVTIEIPSPSSVATPTFSPEAGTYTSTQSVTLACETDGATIYYTTDDSTPTSSSTVYTSAISVSETTTIKAIAKKDDNYSSVASATYTIYPVLHAGTEADPYTVADARNAIDANTGLSNVYVAGIVCEGGSELSGGAMNYWISDDGTETNKFEIYKGKGISGEDFSSTDDVQVGDEVVVTGTIKKFNSTYEFQSGSQLASLNHPSTPLITVTPSSLTGFTYSLGSGPSTAQTISVSGSNLSANINLSLGESNYEMSLTEGSGYTNSLTLTQAAGTVDATTVYVRLKAGLAINASYNGTVTLTSTGAINKTVNLAGSVTEPSFIWDLSTNSYSNPTANLVTWYHDNATMTLAKGTSSNPANNYLGGDANNRTSTRFYKDQVLTITPVGYSITSVVFTAASDGYATALKNSSWTNATAVASFSTVTITPTNGAAAISATIGATCGFTAVTVYYTPWNHSMAVDGEGNLTDNVVIEEGGTENITNLTIPTNYFILVEGVLNVSGTLTNNGTAANIIIADGGQLIHTAAVNATVKKDVTGSSWSKESAVDGWYTIASPVANAPVSSATTGNYDFFAYNEANAKWLNQKVGANSITNFVQGIGYLYAHENGVELSYAGEMVGTGTEITKELSYACENASYKGFNLMGNPFSRNIVYGDIEIAGTPVTTYYTVEGGSELTSKNLSENPIKPGQGFLVQATGIGQNLVFNPSAKGRANEKVGYISIVAGNSEFTDNAFVQLGDGNTLRKMTLSDNSSVVYVMNNGKDYASTRIDALEGSMPVCFKANTLGTYTITIEAKDIETNYLHLIDNFTHEDIDLLLEPSYTFIASNGDNAVRFTLVFNANNSSVENDIFAYQNGSDIIVNGEGELQVFDMMGRMIATQHINGVQTVNMPSNGVYIFKLNEKTQKIVVR